MKRGPHTIVLIALAAAGALLLGGSAQEQPARPAETILLDVPAGPQVSITAETLNFDVRTNAIGFPDRPT
jgi:hypothetical protein